MSITLVEVQVFSLAPNVTERRVGGAVTQRSAKPFRRVRLSYVPPQLLMNSSLDGAIFALAILLVQGRLTVGNGLG